MRVVPTAMTNTDTSAKNGPGPALRKRTKLTTAPARAPELVTPFRSHAMTVKTIVTRAACQVRWVKAAVSRTALFGYNLLPINNMGKLLENIDVVSTT